MKKKGWIGFLIGIVFGLTMVMPSFVHADVTIDSNQTTTQDLVTLNGTSTSYNATVTGGADVTVTSGDALWASAGGWTVNVDPESTVSSPNGGGYGVYFGNVDHSAYHDGAVTNRGLISGYSAGILMGSGNVDNYKEIQSSNGYGVEFYSNTSSTATVNNYGGKITGSSEGIYFYSGTTGTATVTNDGGEITGNNNGVYLYNGTTGALTVKNSGGKITGNSGSGVYLESEGLGTAVVLNGATIEDDIVTVTGGTINGNFTGVSIFDAAAANVTNYDKITGGMYGVQIYAWDEKASATVFNGAGATIRGGIVNGIDIRDAGTVQIDNYGTITSGSEDGYGGQEGIFISGAESGYMKSVTVNNYAGALITGHGPSMMSGGCPDGPCGNEGLAIYMGSYDDDNTIDVMNAGKITGNDAGVSIFGNGWTDIKMNNVGKVENGEITDGIITGVGTAMGSSPAPILGVTGVGVPSPVNPMGLNVAGLKISYANSLELTNSGKITGLVNYTTDSFGSGSWYIGSSDNSFPFDGLDVSYSFSDLHGYYEIDEVNANYGSGAIIMDVDTVKVDNSGIIEGGLLGLGIISTEDAMKSVHVDNSGTISGLGHGVFDIDEFSAYVDYINVDVQSGSNPFFYLDIDDLDFHVSYVDAELDYGVGLGIVNANTVNVHNTGTIEGGFLGVGVAGTETVNVVNSGTISGLGHGTVDIGSLYVNIGYDNNGSNNSISFGFPGSVALDFDYGIGLGIYFADKVNVINGATINEETGVITPTGVGTIEGGMLGVGIANISTEAIVYNYGTISAMGKGTINLFNGMYQAGVDYGIGVGIYGSNTTNLLAEGLSLLHYFNEYGNFIPEGTDSDNIFGIYDMPPITLTGKATVYNEGAIEGSLAGVVIADVAEANVINAKSGTISATGNKDGLGLRGVDFLYSDGSGSDGYSIPVIGVGIVNAVAANVTNAGTITATAGNIGQGGNGGNGCYYCNGNYNGADGGYGYGGAAVGIGILNFNYYYYGGTVSAVTVEATTPRTVNVANSGTITATASAGLGGKSGGGDIPYGYGSGGEAGDGIGGGAYGIAIGTPPSVDYPPFFDYFTVEDITATVTNIGTIDAYGGKGTGGLGGDGIDSSSYSYWGGIGGEGQGGDGIGIGVEYAADATVTNLGAGTINAYGGNGYGGNGGLGFGYAYGGIGGDAYGGDGVGIAISDTVISKVYNTGTINAHGGDGHGGNGGDAPAPESGLGGNGGGGEGGHGIGIAIYGNNVTVDAATITETIAEEAAVDTATIYNGAIVTETGLTITGGTINAYGGDGYGGLGGYSNNGYGGNGNDGHGGEAIGIEVFSAATANVYNYGAINAVGGNGHYGLPGNGVSGYGLDGFEYGGRAYGIQIHSSVGTANVYNYGAISATGGNGFNGGGNAYGIYVGHFVDEAHVYNYGTISAYNGEGSGIEIEKVPFPVPGDGYAIYVDGDNKFVTLGTGSKVTGLVYSEDYENNNKITLEALGAADFNEMNANQIEGFSYMEKTGPGTWVLNGDQDFTAWSMPLTVTGGVLAFGARETSAGIQVSSLTVAPGAKIGLAVTASPTVTAPVGAAGALTVPGAANLGDGKIVVIPSVGTYLPTTTYEDVLNLGGTITVNSLPVLNTVASWAQVTSTAAYLHPTLIYSGVPGVYDLGLERLSFTTGAPESDTGLANFFDEIYGTEGVPDYIQDLLNGLLFLSPADAQRALAQLSGGTHTAFQLMSFNGIGNYLGVLNNHMGGGGFAANNQQKTGMAWYESGIQLAMAGGGNSMNDAAPMMLAALGNAGVGQVASGTNWGIWIDGYLSAANRRTDDVISKYHQKMYGGMMGFDFRVANDLFFGISGGISRTDLDFDDLMDNGNMDSYQGSVYVCYDGKPWYASGIFTYARNNYELDRFITVLGPTQIARSDYSGNEYVGYAEIGYKFNPGGVEIRPLAAFQVDYMKQDAFVETGSDYNLAVESNDVGSYQSFLGVNVSGTIKLGSSASLKPELRLKWAHEFSNDDHMMKAAFVGAGSGFTVMPEELTRDSAIIGLGLNLAFNKNVGVYVQYDAELNRDYINHTGLAGLRIAW